MNTSLDSRHTAYALRVVVAEEAITVDLSDGRTVTAPIAWYPRLLHGRRAERSHWRLVGGGEGIHWPDLDEDISVEGLLGGQPSGESQASFKRWLAARENKRSPGKLLERTGRTPRRSKRRA